jgi:hypothetical protein
VLIIHQAVMVFPLPNPLVSQFFHALDAGAYMQHFGRDDSLL